MKGTGAGFRPYSWIDARLDGAVTTMMRLHLRWTRVLVSGPSMVPALRHGDLLIASRRATVRPGDVVLARFRSMPERLVVKRADRMCEGGWWLSSDNGFAGGDSAVHGVADVSARVLFRLGPGRPGRVLRRPS